MGVSVFGTHVGIRTPHILLDKLYIIDEQLHYLKLML